MSPFAFLKREWPDLFEAADRAASALGSDPRAACFYARRTLELAVAWAYKHDRALRLPYQDNLSALIHDPTFKAAAGEAVFAKARVINTLGNRAVHGQRPVPESDALISVRELFHVTYWLARTYARRERPAPGLTFDPALLPSAPPAAKQTADGLQKIEAALHARDEKLSALLADREALDAELQRLRTEVAAAKQAAAAQPDTHDYSEAETRDVFIDLLLREAGWTLDQARDREYEVSGMPNNQGRGFVDYVLWGDDGTPLALVEAKRTRRDPRAGKQQAKLYADCLEARFGKRPVIFYTNGYEHWIWDDERYPPRSVQGFYKKDELELMVLRRSTLKRLADAPVAERIVERPYQTRAIRRIAEAFERDLERKALLVMATGAGKTRTVIALSDLLLRCNWAKRVLFLADRVALVNQAVNAFKTHLPESSPVNLGTERDSQGRVYVSTYPTMMGLIEESREGQRRFGPGHFDLVVIDEAHRSVYQKYRAIFDYFDSLLVGLTATPKDEIDRNTYGLFDLEPGVPTDVYDLDDAVRDGYLVPPRAVSVNLRFPRQGIRYDELSEEEKEAWDAAEWSEDGRVPERVEPAAINRWLFNDDTVDKVLAHLMERGLKVEGGDRIGKTIVFAKNHEHAEFIAERFDANYPRHAGHAARVIDFKVEYAQSLIDAFASPARKPDIAISVDMLDTGIDVPEVVNLVFFKPVRSKTKFWQMIGRGTRLRPDLFGPGQDKEFFYVFDYCENLEFFNANPEADGGSAATPLGERLFKARLELIGALDADREKDVAGNGVGREEPGLPGYRKTSVRGDTAALLHGQVSRMNPGNFLVRPKRRIVEKYATEDAWQSLGSEAHRELGEIAGLPSESDPEREEAKRFDLLVLRLQLALLRAEPGFERLRDQVQEIAGLLEERTTIPAIREQHALLLDLLSEVWWQDVTVPLLENVRTKVRGLVHLIDRGRRQIVFTDFDDTLVGETEFEIGGLRAADSYSRFRAKARDFLRSHVDHLTVRKLRMNQPLTPSDLNELERLLAESGVGTAQDLERAKSESQGLGLFVRSLLGMDQHAAQQAFARFIEGRTLSANQIEFVSLIVEHLTHEGAVPVERLYEPPYTDLHSSSVDGLFTSADADQIVEILEQVRARAVA